MEAVKQGGCTVGVRVSAIVLPSYCVAKRRRRTKASVRSALSLENLTVSSIWQGKSHSVLAALKLSQADLSSYQKKIFKIDNHIGVSVSGLIADGRILCRYMRNECLNHKFVYESQLPVSRLVRDVADRHQVRAPSRFPGSDSRRCNGDSFLPPLPSFFVPSSGCNRSFLEASFRHRHACHWFRRADGPPALPDVPKWELLGVSRHSYRVKVAGKVFGFSGNSSFSRGRACVGGSHRREDRVLSWACLACFAAFLQPVTTTNGLFVFLSSTTSARYVSRRLGRTWRRSSATSRTALWRTW